MFELVVGEPMRHYSDQDMNMNEGFGPFGYGYVPTSLFIYSSKIKCFSMIMKNLTF